MNYREIRHPDKMIVRHDPAAIKADSNYFSDKMMFMLTPFELSEWKEFDRIFDTLINNQAFYVYEQMEVKPSVVDSTQMVKRDKLYYIGMDDKLIREIESRTIIDGDTLQMIKYTFTDIRFDEFPYDFSGIESPAYLTYRELSADDLENERHLLQITVGDQLTVSSYVDMHGRKVSLYGTSKSQSLIMFSFMGCGGCEYAMRELKRKNFKIREDLGFYYSSPLDNKTSVQSYLQKKDFPFAAFSKESQMNEDFSVYSFPTFVLIDSKGTVIKVVSGYDNEVGEMIF